MPNRTLLLLGFGLLAGCAPVLKTQGPVLLVPGGRIVGAWAEFAGGFPLPAPPLFADAQGPRLYVAYPYAVEVYEEGMLVESYDLPGRPAFLHARPEPVAGLTNGVHLLDQGFRPYPAQDARKLGESLYWIDAKGQAWRGDALLDAGSYRQVVADPWGVFFLGEEAFSPDRPSFALPPYTKADFYQHLYLLNDEGVLALDKSGLILARKKGAFLDLAADASGVWLLDAEYRVVHLNHDLEAVP